MGSAAIVDLSIRSGMHAARDKHSHARSFAQVPPPATEQIRPAAENKLASSYRGPLPFSDVLGQRIKAARDHSFQSAQAVISRECNGSHTALPIPPLQSVTAESDVNVASGGGHGS